MVKTEAKDTKPASKAFESIQKGLSMYLNDFWFT